MICRRCRLDLPPERYRSGRLTCRRCSDGKPSLPSDTGIGIPIDVDLSEWDQDTKTEPATPVMDCVHEASPSVAFRAPLEKWLLVPDCHVPYHDELAFSLMLRAADAIDARNVALLGDFADFYAVSSHEKDPRRRNDLAWEVEQVNAALDRVDSVCTGRRLFIEGNHEDRLRRYLMTRADALFTSHRVEDLFRLQQRGYEHTPYKQHAKIGRLHLTHDTGSAGRYAAHRALDAFQGNVVIGHTHRLAYLVEGTAKGTAHVGAMLGWLGDVSKVDYMHRVKANRDWAHAFGLLYVEPNDAVHVVPVPIVNGRVVVEGQLIT